MSKPKFTWVPSYGSRVSVKPTVNVTKFGDGYEQRVSFGINNQPRTWELTLTNKPLAVADAIVAFLRQQGAVHAFEWTPPGEPTAPSGMFEASPVPATWVCREWSVQPTSPRHRTITCTFEEVFEF